MANESETENIEFLAGLLLTDDELSTILEVDLQCLRVEIQEGITGRAKAIVRGRLLRKARLRVAELTMAEAGSSPALSAARDMLNKLKSA